MYYIKDRFSFLSVKVLKEINICFSKYLFIFCFIKNLAIEHYTLPWMIPHFLLFYNFNFFFCFAPELLFNVHFHIDLTISLGILQMVPLCNISLSSIGFSLHGRQEYLTSCVNFSLIARSYNDKYEAWEPLVEPVDGILRWSCQENILTFLFLIVCTLGNCWNLLTLF